MSEVSPSEVSYVSEVSASEVPSQVSPCDVSVPVPRRAPLLRTHKNHVYAGSTIGRELKGRGRERERGGRGRELGAEVVNAARTQGQRWWQGSGGC